MSGAQPSAREEILDRIRRANVNAGVRDGRGTGDPHDGRRDARDGVQVDGMLDTRPGVGHDKIETSNAGNPSVLELFVDRTADYQAVVERCASDELGAFVAAALEDASSVVVPDCLDATWIAQLPKPLIVPDPGEAAALDSVDAVVSGAAVGIAETGTIVLDHTAGQGRRALTLVPDLHVCVVRASQVVADVPSAIGRLREAATSGYALTWISGPSATSDIELNRVEGVHGPRRLHVIVVTDA